MIVAISVVAGLVLGLLFRWWALVAAVAVGLWVGATTDVSRRPVAGSRCGQSSSDGAC
jgi:hypothetical protein